MVDGHVRLLALDLCGSLSWFVVSSNESSTIKLFLNLLVRWLVLLDELPSIRIMRSSLWPLVRLEIRGSVHRESTTGPLLVVGRIISHFLSLDVLRLNLGLLLVNHIGIDYVVCMGLVDARIP